MIETPSHGELAPAKVNLALHVRGRRADGYHDIETWFAFTEFGDRLIASPAPDWQLTISGPEAGKIPVAADNLVLQAARAFAKKTDDSSRFSFHIEKQIPVAAGLGGGSADAAAALRLLNRLSPRQLTDDQLSAIAATLGADVPACLWSRSSIGSGTGGILQDAPPFSGLPLLLVNPAVPVATGAVFEAWDGKDGGEIGADWRGARNDLQPPAIRLQPVIAEVLEWLQAIPGARHVRMSGSGATCFAVFPDGVPEITPPDGWWVMPTRLL